MLVAAYVCCSYVLQNEFFPVTLVHAHGSFNFPHVERPSLNSPSYTVQSTSVNLSTQGTKNFGRTSKGSNY